jgi:hypothetical protein
MASRKQQKEELRRQRLEAEKREADATQRRLMLGYLVAGLLAAAVVAGLVIVIATSGGGSSSDDFCSEAHVNTQFGTPPKGVAADCREGTAPPAVKQADLQRAADAAGCELMLDLPDEGNSHIKPTDPEPNYKTNPPTSGNHIVPPLQAADGAYSQPIQPVYFVHSLEHGRVEIQYSPKLSEDDQLALKGVFDESPAGMLLFPNPDMPYAVATTAWTQLMGCKHYNERVVDAIRAFRDTYRGRGPEPVPF